MRTPQPLPQALTGVPFTLSQARRHGIDEIRLRAHDIHHPFHGVNLSAVPSTVHELCRAYLPVMPAEAFFSHTTAAALLGVPLPPEVPDEPLHVSVLSPRTAPHGRGIVGHSLRMLAGSSLGGLPVMAPGHVWCQLAGDLSPEDLVAAGDHLIGARTRSAQVTVETLRALTMRLHRTKGARARAWALPRIREGADSRPETLLRLQLEELGAHDIQVNRPVVVDEGRLTLHPDLSLPDSRLAFEYEGDGHRSDRRQWALDIQRRELLEAAGWRVMRVTAADLFHDRRTFLARLERFAPNLANSSAKSGIWRKW